MATGSALFPGDSATWQGLSTTWKGDALFGWQHSKVVNQRTERTNTPLGSASFTNRHAFLAGIPFILGVAWRFGGLPKGCALWVCCNFAWKHGNDTTNSPIPWMFRDPWSLVLDGFRRNPLSSKTLGWGVSPAVFLNGMGYGDRGDPCVSNGGQHYCLRFLWILVGSWCFSQLKTPKSLWKMVNWYSSYQLDF